MKRILKSPNNAQQYPDVEVSFLPNSVLCAGEFTCSLAGFLSLFFLLSFFLNAFSIGSNDTYLSLRHLTF